MIIDYKNITEEKKMNFKGGNGELDTRDYIDAKNKIMMSRLQPGANTGYHKHEMNSEIVYIISGEGYFRLTGFGARANIEEAMERFAKLKF